MRQAAGSSAFYLFNYFFLRLNLLFRPPIGGRNGVRFLDRIAKSRRKWYEKSLLAKGPAIGVA